MLTYVLPGNPALVQAGLLATPEYIAEMEQRMGLDQPWVQYWRYIGGLLQGDLGQSSSTGRPVLEDFRQRLPATLELTLASLLHRGGVGMPLGVLSAVHRDTRSTMSGASSSVAGVAMPTFWTACWPSTSSSTARSRAGAARAIGRNIEPPTTITGLYVVESC